MDRKISIEADRVDSSAERSSSGSSRGRKSQRQQDRQTLEMSSKRRRKDTDRTPSPTLLLKNSSTPARSGTSIANQQVEMEPLYTVNTTFEHLIPGESNRRLASRSLPSGSIHPGTTSSSSAPLTSSLGETSGNQSLRERKRWRSGIAVSSLPNDPPSIKGLGVRKKKPRRSDKDSQSKQVSLASKSSPPLCEKEECGICFEVVDDRGILDCCKHIFCFTCIDKWLDRSCRCPHCKRVVTKLSSSKSKKSRDVVHRELKDTLDEEEEEDDEDENEFDDIHDVLDQVSIVARSLGYRFFYEHRTEPGPGPSSSQSLRFYLQQPQHQQQQRQQQASPRPQQHYQQPQVSPPQYQLYQQHPMQSYQQPPTVPPSSYGYHQVDPRLDAVSNANLGADNRGGEASGVRYAVCHQVAPCQYVSCFAPPAECQYCRGDFYLGSVPQQIASQSHSPMPLTQVSSSHPEYVSVQPTPSPRIFVPSIQYPQMQPSASMQHLQDQPPVPNLQSPYLQQRNYYIQPPQFYMSNCAYPGNVYPFM